MPVFSFHLVDATSSSDLGGQEYDDAVQATEVADLLTRRLAVEEPALLGGGWAIVVSDERGEVYRSAIEPERVH
ncbi:hypothetical protein [Bradyrhizobium sp. G127]|jgi:hypothetical protein|uniref:DUF6894 family protein n=1 Tax=Bradyrhizobium sp. G127 TaxID=2904800 RepID=UPI001F353A5D|nr:hypothetical protein [Bradyrhizobium sp. G127]MCF2523541.1 hypothetical protein [Bradyrhizobium sp. G127]